MVIALHTHTPIPTHTFTTHTHTQHTHNDQTDCTYVR